MRDCAGDDSLPTADLAEQRPIAATLAAPTDQTQEGATLLDDLMLGVLIVGLVACAVFVWHNLPRFLATG